MSKTILMMGGSGFIGSALGESLAADGWKIKLLTRKISDHEGLISYPCSLLEWENGLIPPNALDDVTVVINLVGQSIADHTWTSKYRSKILNSRIDAVRALKKALHQQTKKPDLILQASAIGFYSSDPDHTYDEQSPSGTGFLAETCQAWESEAQELAQSVRLVIMRSGLVLGWEGGAFPTLHDIYCSGLGARLGHGQQWMNWIHIRDVIRFVKKTIADSSYEGAFNLVAPNNVRNKDFHQLLSQYTPSLQKLKAPQIATKMLLGTRSELVLQGSHVLPKKLLDANFKFEFATLSQCFKELFDNTKNTHAHVLHAHQWLPISIQEAWSFVATAENLEKITPPWLNFKVLKTSTPSIEKATRIEYKLLFHGIALRWTSEISSWEKEQKFSDKQIRGPYKSWNHQHTFENLGEGTLIKDHIEYTLPCFPLGELALPLVKRDLKIIFNYRKQALKKLLGKFPGKNS